MKNKESLVERLSQVKRNNIFCAGDIMLDQNSFNSSERLSPEGPFPVLKMKSFSYNLGGVGNVFNNLIEFSNNVFLYSLVGKDDSGKIIKSLLPKNKSSIKVFEDKRNKTTHKNRIFSGSNQIIRIDDEEEQFLDPKFQAEILSSVRKNLRKDDLFIISDYRKGFFNETFTKKLILLIKKMGGKSLVDPKSNSFEKYSNSFLVKPNYREFCDMCGEKDIPIESIAKHAKNKLKKYKIENILITLGENGMILVTPEKKYVFSASAEEVFDVSGAGDTVIATISNFLSLGSSIKEAVRLSNVAAGIAVNKLGTTSVSYLEIFQKDISEELILHNDHLTKKQLKKLLGNSKKIGFTNGCFDILHPGHCHLMREAKKECDFLIIGLNSDKSVRSLKGPERPINSVGDRAKLLESLKFVDMIIIFEEKTPLNLIKKIKPDFLFKGSDYKIDQIVGSSFVKSYSGKVKRISLLEDRSSTRIIKKLK